LPDRYPFHRLALAPLLPGATDADLEQSCQRAMALGAEIFAHFLCQQGLAPLWDERLDNHPVRLSLAPGFTGQIHQARLQATATYLLQRHSLARIRDILDSAGVTHVVTKGAHVRELYYPSPALRPATDIDVLIHPRDRVNAIRAFQRQGFAFQGAARNIAQDCSLVQGRTDIDLHWDILRPGRTRQPMVETLLANRVDCDSHWGMDHAGTLFLMLVHPVFRKYTTTPHATLVRLLDLVQLLTAQPGVAAQTESLLDLAGLRAAGWVTARWLHLLTDSPAAGNLSASLAPGRVRRWWLQRWLTGNWATRLLNHPGAIQLGFTLPTHDRWQDAARALRIARRCRLEGAQTLALLEGRLR
jgi:hypothetical protein